jgi:Fuc2NAc and GlcNAc transferase
MMSWALLFILAGAMSFILTGILRGYAIKRKLLDIPNLRSSHAVPTPRGGGVAIVVVFLFGVTALALFNAITISLLIALLGAGGWVALIGFVDDHGHISAHWRLIAHFAGAGWALVWLGGLPPLPMFGYMLDLGLVGDALAVFYLVWMLNLYNFMDGIDGIAGIEGLTACLGGVLLYLLPFSNGLEWLVPALLLASIVGFLLWNFPSAKIFMGDAGSGFLGLMMGVLSIHAAWVDPAYFWGWVIMLGVFLVDATMTLLRRVVRGERIFEAHRSHAYQYAARKYGSHKIVSVVVGVINLVWLLPIAIVVGLGWLDGLLGLVLGYLPLVWLAFRLNAGARELQEG